MINSINSKEKGKDIGKYRAVITKQEEVIKKLESMLQQRQTTHSALLPIESVFRSDDISTMDSGVFKILTDENIQLNANIKSLEEQVCV